ncbi:glycoside hydrolase family 15 protein [Streptomyces sp. S465]|uniref:glycoside hydrolase family 15 protein n=1 Tax=Streptomyces sp. S465 TaxID=2979468 RepID=UPI0022A885AD|nr:glycoside hydrolase family 15 protein [Streptomyces sp. S465]WAP53729.1 glycoside hydrolase family 15 protein [Streptomyces sp. S465]
MNDTPPGPRRGPTPSTARASSPWTLREYAFLGDGERGALVGPRGEMAWLCAPRWHSDAVFSTLIGGPGEYLLGPEDHWNVWGGFYEEGTLIHVGRWVTGDGVIECREALAVPAAPDRLVLLRRIRAVRGDAHVRLRLDVRPGFGAHTMTGMRQERGIWSAHGGGLHLRLVGAADATPGRPGVLEARPVVTAGHTHDLVLEIGTGAGTEELDPKRLWEATERHWAGAVPDCSELAAPRDARHAYAILRGLTSSSGAMVAAATTSLPERAESGRNYDYRFAWIRDQCYAGLAVAAHGPHPLLDAGVGFVTERLLADGGDLRPAYTVDGDTVAEERSLPLPGYPGGTDRVGNRAGRQFQLDSFGEILQLYAAAARLDRLEGDARRALDVAAAAVERDWTRPDAGLWELENHWWTHSRLCAVAGLRAAAREVRDRAAARHWDGLAEAILRETRRRCLSPRGHWCRAEDDAGPEAALLLPLARGCLPPDDPSGPRTRRFIEARLSQDGYLYRFGHGDQRLGEAEGAFLLCGFMMALAAHHQRDTLSAFRWFERTRAACGPPGLFAEEYDVRQRQLRGNLPQAFVHAQLLEAAVRLMR